LEFEMIGQADSAVKPTNSGSPDGIRSNLGPELAKQGAKPRGDRILTSSSSSAQTTSRSARRGVVAQTSQQLRVAQAISTSRMDEHCPSGF